MPRRFDPHQRVTAQSEDILAWLENAITERERWATVAAVSLMGVPEGGVWQQRRDEHRGGYRIFRPDPDATPESVAFAFGESEAMHITLNDPKSVLRRCAADRKLLALHNTPGHVFPDAAYMDDNRWCVGCGYGNDGEPLTSDVNDCLTLRALAEGYGWTGGER